MFDRLSSIAAGTLALSLLSASPAAQDPPAATHGPTSVVSKVRRGVLYRQGAEIGRAVDLDLDPGIHELLFRGIPDPEGEGLPGLRASASDGWSIVGVQVVPAWKVGDREATRARLEAERDDAEDRLARRTIDAEGLESDLELIEAIGVQATTEATADVGSAGFDLQNLQRRLEFVRAERTRIRLERLALERDLERLVEDVEAVEARLHAFVASGREVAARVRVEVAEAGRGTVSIRYLRNASSWDPTYAIRSDEAEDEMRVDYEATVRQDTGEAWNDVVVVLSTARPALPGMPADIRPVFVDRRRPEAETPDVAVPSSESLAEQADSSPSRPAADPPTPGVVVEAGVGGPEVAFEIAERASIGTDADTPTRLNIASIEAPAKRVLVSRPVVEERIFLRGDLVNESGYVLLPGEAALYVQGEYVGPFELEEVPAGGSFEVWFGPTLEIGTERRVLDRRTQKTGLLGGGLQTTIEYRIDLRNDGDDPAVVEVWDRRPVSRDEGIEIQVVDADPPMADDAVHRGLATRRGLLKWVIELGPAGTPEASKEISWTVQVNRPGDLEVTPIPD
ncbi:MAG: mucoidy inhibitor MuiA family protein [Planctomycetota bacterium]|nr:mucoidy inhibitor MuiA family protein [Planctomycetota bacterium]